MHRYFKLGTNLIDSYNIFLLIALIIVSLIIEKQIDNLHLEKRKITLVRLFMPIAVVVGLFGASLFEIISQNKSIVLENFDSGLTFYGGLITGLILVVFYGWTFKIPILFLLNFYSKPLVLGHAIGRVGCFFAGCCYGKPTSFILGVKFPINSLPYLQYGACKIHPTQLYESIFLFLVFILMTQIKSIYHFITYGLAYGVFRFFIELLRADSRGKLLGIDVFSPSQIISVFLIGFCIFIFFRLNRKIITQPNTRS